MSTKQHIHIIDDDQAIRNSLKSLLSIKGYHPHTYSSGQNFLETVDAPAGGCVITDLKMPEMTGIDLLNAMKELRIQLPVIVMTAFADISIAVDALKKGAVDFIEKPFSSEALCKCVEEALVQSINENAHFQQRYSLEQRMSSLTAREHDVLNILMQGKSNKTIAYELGIGIRTVETHRANLMEKMKAGSLSELLRMSLMVNGFEKNLKESA